VLGQPYRISCADSCCPDRAVIDAAGRGPGSRQYGSGPAAAPQVLGGFVERGNRSTVVMTVQSRPSAKETWAQTLSLVCPRKTQASRSVPDLTSAGDLSFLRKHHAISELGFSPLFLSRPHSSFLSSRTVPENFPKSPSWQYGLLAIAPAANSAPSSLAGVAGNRQKTDDLHRDHLHERHRREDHCVADIRALGRRHLRRIHKNGGISCCAGRHAD
jgi:hypothetical protein